MVRSPRDEDLALRDRYDVDPAEARGKRIGHELQPLDVVEGRSIGCLENGGG